MWFPSPYRGYHLSTISSQNVNQIYHVVSVPLSGLSSFNLIEKFLKGCEILGFPSPYRGYHLSTCNASATSKDPLIVSVPLSGLSSFNMNGDNKVTVQYNNRVSVPLSGLSSFNYRHILSKVSRWSFPSPYRGYHLSTLPPFSPYFIRLSRGFSVPKI